jgi:hypothetical protein
MKPLKYWTPDTFELSSYKFKLKDRINKSYNTSGSDNSGLCIYTYNELGFRGDCIHKEGFKIMSLGCSLTEGVGVNDSETWPAEFGNLIANSVNLNFGTGGRSNDFISRCLLSYFELIKPDLVLIMYTYPTRKEIFTKDGGVEPYIPTSIWGYLEETEDGIKIQKNLTDIQNDFSDIQNWYKNHLLITNFLKANNTPFLWNGSFLNTDYIDENRFDGDYATFIDFAVDGAHPGPKHNKEYSKKLYSYLIDNQQVIKNTLK